ncbi:hypothetical protein D8M03_13940 [Lysinibacillus endophyticus]|uniref:Uncharacterized protein n=1 Tax=Ureibacillus endophyticus TaxID=1978490 RepID=A0A494YXP7_9BACL|nr:hypothetical protein D8M03_13940 [Lysinibacillus endophyticus]
MCSLYSANVVLNCCHHSTKSVHSSTVFFELFKQFKKFIIIEIVFFLEITRNILFQLIFLKIFRILNLSISIFKKKGNAEFNGISQ